jgi:hypothetical protein
MRSRQSAASKKIVDSRWLVLHNPLPRLTALSHPYTERVVSEAFYGTPELDRLSSLSRGKD